MVYDTRNSTKAYPSKEACEQMDLLQDNSPNIEPKFGHTGNWDYPTDKLKSQQKDGRFIEPWKTGPKENARMQNVSPTIKILIQKYNETSTNVSRAETKTPNAKPRHSVDLPKPFWGYEQDGLFSRTIDLQGPNNKLVCQTHSNGYFQGNKNERLATGIMRKYMIAETIFEDKIDNAHQDCLQIWKTGETTAFRSNSLGAKTIRKTSGRIGEIK